MTHGEVKEGRGKGCIVAVGGMDAPGFGHLLNAHLFDPGCSA